jgi:hydrogenase maturation protease
MDRRVGRWAPFRRASLFMMKTIVVGLGNPILGDDGVGWMVASEVKKHLVSRHALRTPPDENTIDVEFLSLGGISLMESLLGYERVILIDALTADQEPGSIVIRPLQELSDNSVMHITSAHDTSLQTALKLGKAMGADLPDEVIVVGIATRHVYVFSDELTPPVAAAVPGAALIVIDLLA